MDVVNNYLETNAALKAMVLVVQDLTDKLARLEEIACIIPNNLQSTSSESKTVQKERDEILLRQFIDIKNMLDLKTEESSALNDSLKYYFDNIYKNEEKDKNKEKEIMKILKNNKLDKDKKEKEISKLIYNLVIETDEWQEANEEVKEEMRKAIIDWSEKTVEANNSVFKRLKNSPVLNDLKNAIKDNAAEIGKFFGNIFESMINSSSKAKKDRLKDDIDNLKEYHQEKIALINEEMQAQLHFLGFVSAATEAQYEEDLEKAKRTGDEVLIYQAQRALQRHQIEEEYAAQQTELNEAMAEREKELAEEQAIVEWRIKLNAAIASAAQSIVTALAGSPWPLNLKAIGFAALTGAIGIGKVASSKPSFATGGIVPGISFSGDRVPAMLNSREGVFTLDDQEYLFDQIQGRKLSGGTMNATLVVMLDSREIAKSTVELVNDGFYTIKARAIR
ncbi:MAG: hypothetical protein FWD26_04975 [Treponema sp.]|nr:hypothetical protein [Treponema sp.]